MHSTLAPRNALATQTNQRATYRTYISRLDRSSQNFSQNEDRYLTLSTLVLSVRGNLSAVLDGESEQSFMP